MDTITILDALEKLATDAPEIAEDELARTLAGIYTEPRPDHTATAALYVKPERKESKK